MLRRRVVGLRALAALWVLAATVGAAAAQAPALPRLVDTRWGEDFEGGTIAGWASYPAAQDTAYDFTILPGCYLPRSHLQGYVGSGEVFLPVDLAPPATPAGNRGYLVRAYRPNSASPQRIGATTALRLHATEAGAVAFDYWVKLTASPVTLLVELAGGDGCRYQHRLRDVVRERWERVRLPLRAFACAAEGLRAGLALQAITIIAEFERGDAATVHHVALDNVEIDAARRAGFEVHRPSTRRLRHWDVEFATRRVSPGEPLALLVQPEVDDVTEVSARLEDVSGRAPHADLRLVPGADGWALERPFTFGSGDARGPWRLVVRGRTGEGQVLERAVRLWLADRPVPGGHPRLLFTGGDLERLRARARSGRGAEIWAAVVEAARAGRRAPILDEGQVEQFPRDYLLQERQSHTRTLRGAARAAMLNALVYAIDGDAEAGAYAKRALLALAQWRQWIHPWFQAQGRQAYLTTGLATLYLGLAYDLAFPLLDEAEAARVRAGVLRNGVFGAYEEYVADNRVPDNTSNWIAHNVGGPLVALLAFMGDGEAGDAEPYFSGLAEKFLAQVRATQRADGGYGEGYDYQHYALETTWAVLASMRGVLGVDALAGALHLPQAYLWPLYASVPAGRHMLEMGDAREQHPSSSNWAWLVHTTRDPRLKWFYDQFRRDGWEDFLFLDESVASAAPDDLPASRAFPEKGNVVFRTGWGDRDEVVLAMRAGPNYNHTHVDQGTFRLWAFGEDLVGEAGYSSYYTDPYFWSYFTQAAGHNVLLVDGNPESQEVGDFDGGVTAFRRRARLDATFLSPVAGWARAELGMLYRGVLDGLSREVFFFGGGQVLVRDRVRSSGGAHRYQWQLHPPTKDSLTIASGRAVITRPRASLDVAVVRPANAGLDVVDTPMPIAEYGKYPQVPLRPRAVLQVSNPTPSAAEEFLVLLRPRRAGDASPRIERDDDGRLRIVHGETVDEVTPGAPAANGERHVGEYSWIRRESGAVTAAAVQSSASLRLDGRQVLAATGPVDAALSRAAGADTWWLQSTRSVQVTLALEPRARVTATGSATIERVGRGAVRVALGPGQATVRVDYPSPRRGR